MTPKSLTRAEDFLAVVRLQCQMLPEYMPNKFDWVEPLKQVFDPENLNNLVFKNGNVDSAWWKRTEKPKARGFWMTRWGLVNANDRTLATISIEVHETALQGKLIEYLKVGSVHNEADIAFIDSLADQYRDIGISNSYAPYRDRFMLSTKLLRNWLPEMPWAVVFGSAYIRLFGKEKVLATPAYKVEEISEEMVYIQLTPRMEDIHEQFELVMQARAVAKKHLGEECFFKPELAYNFNAEPDKAGKVYKVPNFILKDDWFDADEDLKRKLGIPL